ncbi:phage tail sheath subtilisin-like domain-containing protein [Endozoicomonas ascidiicola]|uniref:phage tail sheath subtilisin-like domain-containing protein n=1 Tax=Endozoicomonas ascidiicola TaxID=1698521 RepID=UPI0008349A50|nr:phage tail sheath subtilisin-like domain-containing protein [Endozoicomonas ascidiicola]
MTDRYLHGCRIIEDDSGARPIRTVASSVIGIVGTAPDAEGALAATATLTTGLNSLLFTSVLVGNASNNIRIVTEDPGADDEALSVKVSGTAIRVSLETGSDSAIITTAAELKTAIEGNASANALVKVTLTDADSGTWKPPVTSVYLAGGQDEPFPIGVPVAISASEVGKIKKLGTEGTLPWVMEIIGRFGGHLCTIVREPEGSDEQETLTNVIGSSTTGRGLWALLKAQNKTGYSPRIIGIPGFSQNQAAANEMISVTERLLGYCYIDPVNNVTYDNAVSYRRKFGAEFGMMLHTWWRERTASGGEVHRPFSAYALGLRASCDNRNGWHTAMSNQAVLGGLGPVLDIDFKLNDPNTTANRLNENHISTVVNTGAGYVFWGCRSLTEDPKKLFENWGRAKGVIYDSLVNAHQWAMDRNITATYVDDVQSGVQNFLNRLRAGQYILNGLCWADAELNSNDSIAMGQFFWNFDYMVPPPAESLNFVAHPQNFDYLTEVISNG